MHFSLIAILDPPSSPAGLRDHLAKALEPFRDVESDIETQHECWNCFYHARHKMEENARQEADGRFGTAVKLADRFKSSGPARPELPTLADSESDAASKWRDYENWAGTWKHFVQKRLDWEQARTAELVAGLKADPRCQQCHGSGVVLTGLEFRKWDYWVAAIEEKSLRGMWQKAIQLHPQIASQFSPDLAKLSGDFEGEAVSGRIMHYLAAHERASIPHAVLTPDCTWHEQQPGIWGIAHLADPKFVIYAEDEFWPLRFRSILEEHVKDGHLCIAVDCHT